MTWVILTAMRPAIGTVTSLNSTGLVDATVTLATMEEIVMNTAQTNINGNYEFIDISPGFYNLTATKRGYWPDSDPVTVTADDPTPEADILRCQKGDLCTNGGQADAEKAT